MEREIFTKSISYADNIVSRIELLISLPPHDWYIFENQPFYQELIDFLHNIQTQERKEEKITVDFIKI